MTDGPWGALGMGRRDPAQDPVAGFLARALGLDQPSLGSRMTELRRMRTPLPGEMASGPPMPGTPEYELATDIAGNFDFAGTFGGLKAKTADMAKYDRAQAMLKKGYDNPTIFENTGWFMGPEGRWRFEIDDTPAEVLRAADTNKKSPVTTFLSHPELEQAYYPTPNQVPKLEYDELGSARGQYIRGNPGEITIANKTIGTPSERSTMLHELQHFIQEREGLPRGGSPSEFMVPQLEIKDKLHDIEKLAKLRSQLADQGKLSTLGRAKADDIGSLARQIGYPAGLMQKLDEIYPTSDALVDQLAKLRQELEEADPFKAYQRLTGEAEARAVEARKDLSPAERRTRFPLQDYDVPIDKLITRYR